MQKLLMTSQRRMMLDNGRTNLELRTRPGSDTAVIPGHYRQSLQKLIATMTAFPPALPPAPHRAP